jgi:hypothetical protein
VNESDLVAGVSDRISLPDTKPAAAMLDGDVGALFGLEMADAPGPSQPLVAAADAKSVRKRGPKVRKQPSAMRKRLRRRPSTKQKRASPE